MTDALADPVKSSRHRKVSMGLQTVRKLAICVKSKQIYQRIKEDIVLLPLKMALRNAPTASPFTASL